MGACHFHYTHMIVKVICICKWRNWSIAQISALHYRPMAECVQLGGSLPYRNGGSLAPFHSSMIIMTLAGPGLENIGLRGKENEGRFPFRSWHLICRENLPRIPPSSSSSSSFFTVPHQLDQALSPVSAHLSSSE